MKSRIRAFLILPALLFAGCAWHQTGLVLDPVGPTSRTTGSTGGRGTLVVFTAYTREPSFSGSPYVREFSDYEIMSDADKRPQRVRNEDEIRRGAPRKLELEAGHYRVVARANGYGTVTVPVVVEAAQETVVHLEGSPAWPDEAALTRSNPVRLPHGEIAGWRAP